MHIKYLNKSIVFLFILFIFHYNRTFHTTKTGESFTVWTPLYGKYSYLIRGHYWGIFSPKKEYFKLYRNKHIYVCITCNKLTFNIGSFIIEKKEVDNMEILSHSTFFEKIIGTYYTNGKLIRVEREKKDSIKRIELFWGGW